MASNLFLPEDMLVATENMTRLDRKNKFALIGNGGRVGGGWQKQGAGKDSLQKLKFMF